MIGKLIAYEYNAEKSKQTLSEVLTKAIVSSVRDYERKYGIAPSAVWVRADEAAELEIGDTELILGRTGKQPQPYHFVLLNGERPKRIPRIFKGERIPVC